jgi:hypothetical protein
MNFNTIALVAVDLAIVKMLEYIRLDQKGTTMTALTGRVHQGHNSSGVTLHAAMIVRALPAAPRLNVDIGATRVDLRKILPPNQRSVTEHPSGVRHPMPSKQLTEFLKR